MSKWSLDEVKNIENGGNEKDQAVWLGSWDPAAVPKPAPGDLDKIRKFIQMKYVERRWYVSPEKALSAAAAPPATTFSVSHRITYIIFTISLH
jgi:hypothetical protein